MVEILIIFTLGYIIGSITALILISLMLASRSSATGQHQPTTIHHL